MRTLKDLVYEKDNIYILDFYELPDPLKNKIDHKLKALIDLTKEPNLATIKSQFLVFFNDKTESSVTKNIGYISEFLAHLFILDEQGIDWGEDSLKQASLLQNLEEPKSPKKGFDGVYFKGTSKEIWIMESKSALPTTKTTHQKKINEAYTSLKGMLENGNNPWLNASRHAHQVDPNLPIKRQLENLSVIFLEKNFIPINDLNIILVGTLFLNEKIPYKKTEKDVIHTSINKDKLAAKKCIPLAITCRVYEAIIEYIKEGAQNESI